MWKGKTSKNFFPGHHRSFRATTLLKTHWSRLQKQHIPGNTWWKTVFYNSNKLHRTVINMAEADTKEMCNPVLCSVQTSGDLLPFLSWDIYALRKIFSAIHDLWETSELYFWFCSLPHIWILDRVWLGNAPTKLLSSSPSKPKECILW